MVILMLCEHVLLYCNALSRTSKTGAVSLLVVMWNCVTFSYLCSSLFGDLCKCVCVHVYVLFFFIAVFLLFILPLFLIVTFMCHWSCSLYHAFSEDFGVSAVVLVRISRECLQVLLKVFIFIPRMFVFFHCLLYLKYVYFYFDIKYW